MTQDVTQDGRWMTYGELARARGIDRPSAVKLVRRQHWRRQPGNHGEVRVFVPSDGLSRAMTRDGARDETLAETPPVAPDMTAFETALAAIEAAHASEVAALRERAEALEVSRVTAQTMADRMGALLAEAGTTIERLRAGLSGAQEAAECAAARAEELKAGQALMTDMHARELTELRQRLERVQDAAEGLRQVAEARKARGRLRRAWDGWRGR